MFAEDTIATNDNGASAPGYHIMTWGCQMNEEDSEQMSLYLEQMGYRPVKDAANADVVLLNTCSVRAKPEDKVWSELGRLREMKHTRPNMIIGVCGCMAQVESIELKRRAPFIDLVVGTSNIASIPDMIRRITGNDNESAELQETALLRNPPRDFIQLSPTRSAPTTRTVTALDLPERKGSIVSDLPNRISHRKSSLKAHVPIMYGCDKFCTFCIVPLTRGRERSRPTADIIDEITGLARRGTREVTLLGQTVNSYGKNMPEGRVPFASLLEQIDAIAGIRRVRFTSPYPKDFTDELIDAIGRLSTVCEHVHLPLQVADDELLLHMHRGYTVSRYQEIVNGLRACVPGISITTDIMLGYPGETDEQFRNTMRFVEQTRFDSAFMFAYSPRPNTKAATMDNQVPHSVKIDRLNELIALQNGITVQINRSNIGREVEVLVEGFSPKDRNRLTGNTRTLKTVNFTIDQSETRSAESFIGKLAQVRVTDAHLTGYTGKLIDLAPL
jgi:tRNA-2-methylthio-N6-dimethylallyladenosine synthase